MARHGQICVAEACQCLCFHGAGSEGAPRTWTDAQTLKGLTMITILCLQMTTALVILKRIIECMVDVRSMYLSVHSMYFSVPSKYGKCTSMYGHCTSLYGQCASVYPQYTVNVRQCTVNVRQCTAANVRQCAINIR